jgi:hypothetical protein
MNDNGSNVIPLPDDAPKKRTIGIFTNFMDFNPGYSLSGIVVDQCLMLLREGHKVVLFTNEQYNTAYDRDAGLKAIQRQYKDQLVVLRETKHIHLTDYESIKEVTDEHKQQAKETAERFLIHIKEQGITRCITHDFVFTGWSVPYALAVQYAQKTIDREGGYFDISWHHWIHSVPSANRDWWNLRDYSLNHFLVFPNRTEIQRVAENFKCSPSRVYPIPHIKDIRTWYGFHKDTMAFIDRYPNMLQSQVIQVYPASGDRLSAKQVDAVIKIFAQLNAVGTLPVFLCIANQWATGRQNKESLTRYIKLGESLGLVYGVHFCFTSEYSTLPPKDETKIKTATNLRMLKHRLEEIGQFDPTLSEKIRKYEEQDIPYADIAREVIEHFQPFKVGISRRMLRELQLVSNLFIFPTLEESFGLVGPEAAFSGSLVITNRSLLMMKEVMGPVPPAFDFGSHHNIHTPTKEEPEYLQAVAMAIYHRIMISEAIQTKSFCRIRYNMDRVYRNYYLPFIV